MVRGDEANETQSHSRIQGLGSLSRVQGRHDTCGVGCTIWHPSIQIIDWKQVRVGDAFDGKKLPSDAPYLMPSTSSLAIGASKGVSSQVRVEVRTNLGGESTTAVHRLTDRWLQRCYTVAAIRKEVHASPPC